MVRTADGIEQVEAAPEDVGLSSRGLAHLSRHVQGYIDDGRLPGAITLVARRGKIVHFETYGQRDVEANKPVEQDTIFRIFSMTKPIVSVALMTLYEEGRFQVDDPVSAYIPRFKGLQVIDGHGTRAPAREMTIADLLRHTSGLASRTDSVLGPAYEEAGLWSSSSEGTLQEAIDKLGTLPLKCDPGAQFNYGVSTDVVGYLCEVLSGRRLDDFLRARIFEPLAMTDTDFYVQEPDLERFAANYRPGGDGETRIVLTERPDGNSRYGSRRSYLSGAGGLVSTASDYARFCKMLAGGGEYEGERIIGPRTLQFMTQNHLPEGRDLAEMGAEGAGESRREGVGFGLGFAVLADAAKAGVAGTPGEYYWGGAASTAFWVSPTDELFVVFMTQLQPSSTYPIRRELRSIVYGSIIH
ncbi:MAG TPA: serine hydrolase domain-containing protein [Dehalococcoidia bacterium]|nr:serine hydrolase domain-containing protein [Dehalococcoidia bacterium]